MIRKYENMKHENMKTWKYKIVFQVICIMNFLAKVLKKNLRPFKEWFGPLLFIKMLLKTGQLLSRYLTSGLFFCVLYFLFHKGKDTSAVPQPSVQYLVYIFPIFFRFYKCFNNFNLSKNILINQFFSLKHVLLYNFTSMTQGSCRFLFEVKKFM